MRCPDCGSDQLAICTPPLVTGVDVEGAAYAIDPPSTFVCLDCRFVGDCEGDMVMEIAA